MSLRNVDQANQQSKVKISNDIRLVGKHYASKNELRRKCCMCTYKINSVTRKRNNITHTTIVKNAKNIFVKACFKDSHTKSSV